MSAPSPATGLEVRSLRVHSRSRFVSICDDDSSEILNAHRRSAVAIVANKELYGTSSSSLHFDLFRGVIDPANHHFSHDMILMDLGDLAPIFYCGITGPNLNWSPLVPVAQAWQYKRCRVLKCQARCQEYFGWMRIHGAGMEGLFLKAPCVDSICRTCSPRHRTFAGNKTTSDDARFYRLSTLSNLGAAPGNPWALSTRSAPLAAVERGTSEASPPGQRYRSVCSPKRRANSLYWRGGLRL